MDIGNKPPFLGTSMWDVGSDQSPSKSLLAIHFVEVSKDFAPLLRVWILPAKIF
jgi:hypothetical protein